MPFHAAPRHFSLKYVSIPAKKCLAQRENSSLPVTLGVFRYTLGLSDRPVFLLYVRIFGCSWLYFLRGFFYRLTDRSNVRFGEVFAAADPRLFLLKPFHLVNSRKLDLLIFQYFCQPFVADTGSICVKTDIGRSLRIECDAPSVLIRAQ